MLWRNDAPSRRLIRKVLAYVLRGGDLLTFTQPEHPEAGLQVPGGTVLPGEPCDRAVLRELAEESGLSLERPRFVGLQYHDMAAYRPEIQERFVYALEAPPGLPPSWLHLETRGGPRPVKFAFCWTPFAAAGGLIAGQGALLAQAPISTRSGRRTRRTAAARGGSRSPVASRGGIPGGCPRTDLLLLVPVPRYVLRRRTRRPGTGGARWERARCGLPAAAFCFGEPPRSRRSCSSPAGAEAASPSPVCA